LEVFGGTMVCSNDVTAGTGVLTPSRRRFVKSLRSAIDGK
jgi:hypothetical protein